MLHSCPLFEEDQTKPLVNITSGLNQCSLFYNPLFDYSNTSVEDDDFTKSSQIHHAHNIHTTPTTLWVI